MAATTSQPATTALYPGATSRMLRATAVRFPDELERLAGPAQPLPEDNGQLALCRSWATCEDPSAERSVKVR